MFDKANNFIRHIFLACFAEMQIDDICCPSDLLLYSGALLRILFYVIHFLTSIYKKSYPLWNDRIG